MRARAGRHASLCAVFPTSGSLAPRPVRRTGPVRSGRCDRDGVIVTKSNNPAEVTRLLNALGRGEATAAAELLEVVYAELRAMAAVQMARESRAHTLQPTALVHEAYVRLLGGPVAPWQNRAHFFGAAGEAMRRILVEQARMRRAQKRGGGLAPVELPADLAAAETRRDDDLLALDDALLRMEQQDARMANIVKLRFFVELSIEETAAALGLSNRTVVRDWTAAKAWLHAELRPRREA